MRKSEMTTIAINYWEDDWEQQLEAQAHVSKEQVPKEVPKEVQKEEDVLESWEDEDEDEEPPKELPTVIKKPKVKATVLVNYTSERRENKEFPDVIEKPKVQASVWLNNTSNARKPKDYSKDFPSMNGDDGKKYKDDDRARVDRLKKKSVHNIYEAFNDDESGLPIRPVSTVSRNPQPRFDREPRQDKPKPRAPIKSRFCRNGANCRRPDCWWAHSENELVPDMCNRGANCRCININYNKEIHNNPRSNRVCMYRHDESISSYLKRTGQSAHVVTVPNRFSKQAFEMSRVSGNMIRIE